MIDSNDSNVKMNDVEMIQNDKKKVWVTPELEVLDAGSTFGGEGGEFAELEYEFHDPDEIVS
jgi:hypothetical protein